MAMRRRRRAFWPGFPGTGVGGNSTWNRFGGGGGAANADADAEAGYVGGQQAGWNADGTAATGAYQPPTGAPPPDGTYQAPAAPPPVGSPNAADAAPPKYSENLSGFAPPPGPPPAAHTTGY